MGIIHILWAIYIFIFVDMAIISMINIFRIGVCINSDILSSEHMYNNTCITIHRSVWPYRIFYLPRCRFEYCLHFTVLNKHNQSVIREFTNNVWLSMPGTSMHNIYQSLSHYHPCDIENCQKQDIMKHYNI